MESPIKMDDLGVPLFSETSKWIFQVLVGLVMTCLLKASVAEAKKKKRHPPMLRWKNPVKQRPRIFGKSMGFFSSTKKDLGPKSAKKKSRRSTLTNLVHIANIIHSNTIHPGCSRRFFDVFLGTGVTSPSCKNIGEKIHPKINHGPPPSKAL